MFVNNFHIFPLLLTPKFNYEKIKKQTLSYLSEMKVGKAIGTYKYSKSAKISNIYASFYACLIFYYYGSLKYLTQEEKTNWIKYFDSYQSKKNGLFYDPVLENNLFADSDWWGARHLLTHLTMAYKVLGGKPKYNFKFLEKYYDKNLLKNWLDNVNWETNISDCNDIDNKIMNIGCLLQYSRDFQSNKKAGKAVDILKKYLESKINRKTGMWGVYDLSKPEELSRMIQFGYHLFQIFFYDKYKTKHSEIIIDFILKNQNKKGGFSPNLNSSACEDIDSTALLIHFSKMTSYKKVEVNKALKKNISWVLSNMNNDGGFIFRKGEVFSYGHKEMSTKKNESSLFATWFRTLNIAYIAKYLDLPNDYLLISFQGYSL